MTTTSLNRLRKKPDFLIQFRIFQGLSMRVSRPGLSRPAWILDLRSTEIFLLFACERTASTLLGAGLLQLQLKKHPVGQQARLQRSGFSRITRQKSFVTICTKYIQCELADIILEQPYFKISNLVNYGEFFIKSLTSSKILSRFFGVTCPMIVSYISTAVRISVFCEDFRLR